MSNCVINRDKCQVKIFRYICKANPRTIEMDQPKIERTLRIIHLLSGNTKHTLDELAETLGVSRRTMFRYLDTLKEAGFVIQRIDEGVYKIVSYEKEYTDLSQLVYFSEEEAIIVSNLIENLSSTNAMKAGLKQKLAAVYDSTSIGDYIQNKGRSDEIELLARAIKEKRQVKLTGYSSAVSNTTKDYIVEPYTFTRDYVDIWACDSDSGHNKMFKISRMNGVELLGDWEMEDRHGLRSIDSFRMSGDGKPIEHVKLKLTLRAKNLLVEEYPVTEQEVYQVKRNWFWEGDINAFEGIGRFVIGLAREINIVNGMLLKMWVLKEGAYVQRKFRNNNKTKK